MGTIYKNGIEYGVGNFMAVRNLTQAEYNALTTAEKNDGTIYLVNDGVPVSVDNTLVKTLTISTPGRITIQSGRGTGTLQSSEIKITYAANWLAISGRIWWNSFTPGTTQAIIYADLQLTDAEFNKLKNAFPLSGAAWYEMCGICRSGTSGAANMLLTDALGIQLNTDDKKITFYRSNFIGGSDRSNTLEIMLFGKLLSRE